MAPSDKGFQPGCSLPGGMDQQQQQQEEVAALALCSVAGPTGAAWAPGQEGSGCSRAAQSTACCPRLGKSSGPGHCFCTGQLLTHVPALLPLLQELLAVLHQQWPTKGRHLLQSQECHLER